MASHEHAPSPGSSEADVAGAFPTVHAHESHADSHEDVQSDGSFDEVDMDEVHEIEDQAELEAISQDMSQGETGMPSLFSLRRPRDARAGLSSGLKSIGKGVAGGVAALFAAPIAGAASDGAKGFFKGVGAGLVGAVMLPVAGVAVGATQMVRGVVNTPEALTSSLAGKKWDESSRQWVEWDPRSAVVLDDDAHRPKSLLETLMAQLKEEEAARNAEGKDDADGEKSDGNEYYDILKVRWDRVSVSTATQAQGEAEAEAHNSKHHHRQKYMKHNTITQSHTSTHNHVQTHSTRNTNTRSSSRSNTDKSKLYDVKHSHYHTRDNTSAKQHLLHQT
eukprot:m.41278 g.41278  ORF g.41278 m.41278 type:complete len:334 (+) comp11444_c0_seq2:242-1243(+)